MRTYEVEIKGKSPLLMHWDNIDWADDMSAWKDDPRNRGDSKAGDDRTPAWRWIGHTYNDGQQVVMPCDNIMRAIMEGGAMVPVPGGRGGKTFKAQTQSGMMPIDGHWPVECDGRLIAWSDVQALMNEKAFSVHKQRVRELGFSLSVKRAKVGTSKHVRVRPQFNSWILRGRIGVWDEKLTKDVLAEILQFAGEYKGLGDWRPGGRTPGPFGRFDAVLR